MTKIQQNETSSISLHRAGSKLTRNYIIILAMTDISLQAKSLNVELDAEFHNISLRYVRDEMLVFDL